MLDLYTKPKAPDAGEDKLVPKRDRFTLPIADGEPVTYVTTIKSEAPFDSFTVGGLIDFAKYVMPPEASSVENSGKHFTPRFPTKMLAENQVRAIKEYVDSYLKKIRDVDSNQEVVVVGEYLILQKQSEFTPFAVNAPDVPAEEKDIASEVKDAIYKAQELKKGKKQ